ncbi:hypothetical protein A9Q78_06565 [Methylophaga sp. 41_12_T18]|nr:hypothetical protein A9Q78_06565 [Methylophaga sp. 41_12_T18]
MLVVKLGGSLYNTKELKAWLTVLASYAEQQTIIIVPGGGPFADQVRTAQLLHQFDDHHAHHMALLAMAQFALLISGLEPQCQLYYYDKTNQPSIPSLSVWLPEQSILAYSEISQDWSVTSDSLALWLSQQLDAEQLTLVKRCPQKSQLIAELVQAQILDASFEQFYRQQAIKTDIIHYQNYAAFNNDNQNTVIHL